MKKSLKKSALAGVLGLGVLAAQGASAALVIGIDWDGDQSFDSNVSFLENESKTGTVYLDFDDVADLQGGLTGYGLQYNLIDPSNFTLNSTVNNLSWDGETGFCSASPCVTSNQTVSSYLFAGQFTSPDPLPLFSFNFTANTGMAGLSSVIELTYAAGNQVNNTTSTVNGQPADSGKLYVPGSEITFSNTTMNVQVTAVPLPMPAFLLGSGLLAMIGLKRVSRKVGERHLQV